MLWITEHAGLAWMATALLLAVLEVLTLDLFFIMLAGGAAAAAVTAWLGGSPIVTVAVAAVVALLLIVVLRPLLLDRVGKTPHRQTGAAALVGQAGRVVETVSSHGGLVKIGGETWSARTEDGSYLPVGAGAVVVRIEGATAVLAARREAVEADN